MAILMSSSLGSLSGGADIGAARRGDHVKERAMAEENDKNKPKVLDAVRTLFVVSTLKPDLTGGFEGHKVALLDTDPRHPFPHNIMVAGPLPVKVAATPAVEAAIMSGNIKEVSPDDAEDLIDDHRERVSTLRTDALRERAQSLGISKEALEHAMATQLMQQYFGGAAAMPAPMPPSSLSSPDRPAILNEDPALRPPGQGQTGTFSPPGPGPGQQQAPEPLTRFVDHTRIGKEELVRLSEDHGLPVEDFENTTKKDIAKRLNAKYNLKPTTE
jgi:hypothetical protein